MMGERPHFLIFARPRSRTAWLANLLTHGDVFCEHEALVTAGSLVRLERQLDALPAHTVGTVDTGLIHFADEACELFPRARLVCLVNEGKAWARFIAKHQIPASVVELVDRAYSRTIQHLNDRHAARTLFVSSDMLDQAPIVRRLHDHLGIGSSFSVARHRMLCGLHVQVDPAELAARIRAKLSS